MQAACEPSTATFASSTRRFATGSSRPGATMTSAEKLEVARALARLGVDVIEAGFPAASPDDLAAVRAIAEEVGSARSRAGRRRAAGHLRPGAREPRRHRQARGRRSRAPPARASTRSWRRRIST